MMFGPDAHVQGGSDLPVADAVPTELSLQLPSETQFSVNTEANARLLPCTGEGLRRRFPGCGPSGAYSALLRPNTGPCDTAKETPKQTAVMEAAVVYRRATHTNPSLSTGSALRRRNDLYTANPAPWTFGANGGILSSCLSALGEMTNLSLMLYNPCKCDSHTLKT